MVDYIWTPDNLRSLYEFFRTTRPFSRWKLPEGDQVEFHVASIKDGAWADYVCDGGKHRIRINYKKTAHLSTLCVSLAHEMVHMACAIARESIDHGTPFKRRAVQVCKIHGFDPKGF